MYHPLQFGATKIWSFFNLSCLRDHNFPGNYFLTKRRVSIYSERIGLCTHINFYDKIWMVWILEMTAFSFLPVFIFIISPDKKSFRPKFTFDHSGSIGERLNWIRWILLELYENLELVSTIKKQTLRQGLKLPNLIA